MCIKTNREGGRKWGGEDIEILNNLWDEVSQSQFLQGAPKCNRPALAVTYRLLSHPSWFIIPKLSCRIKQECNSQEQHKSKARRKITGSRRDKQSGREGNIHNNKFFYLNSPPFSYNILCLTGHVSSRNPDRLLNFVGICLIDQSWCWLYQVAQRSRELFVPYHLKTEIEPFFET
jgi:hypothetical protein